MHILIAGGGIGGLTAALAFLKAGHTVSVLEQAPEIADVGAGIQISPNGMKVLDALGASARVARDAFRPRAQELRLGRSGGRIFSVPLREASQARWRGEYLHIHRADLIEALQGCVVDRASDAIRLGARVTAYESSDTGVTAVLSDGEKVTGDLLVGASMQKCARMEGSPLPTVPAKQGSGVFSNVSARQVSASLTCRRKRPISKTFSFH